MHVPLEPVSETQPAVPAFWVRPPTAASAAAGIRRDTAANRTGIQRRVSRGSSGERLIGVMAAKLAAPDLVVARPGREPKRLRDATETTCGGRAAGDIRCRR